MEYILITLLAISATTFIIYILANKVFGVFLRLKSLILCAACALFISIVLPRIVVSFAGLAGTVGFLAVFAVIFAYLVAYYDDPRDLQPVSETNMAGAPLQTEAISATMTETFSEPPSLSEPSADPHLPVVLAASLSSITSQPAEMENSTLEAEEATTETEQPCLAAGFDNILTQSLPEPEASIDFASLVFETATGDQDPESLPEFCQLALHDDVSLEGKEEKLVCSVPFEPTFSESELPFILADEPEFDQDLLAAQLEMLQLTSMPPFVPAHAAQAEPILPITAEPDPVLQSDLEPRLEPEPRLKAKQKGKTKIPAALEPESEQTPVGLTDPKSEILQPEVVSESLLQSPLAAKDALKNLPATANLPENQEVTDITVPTVSNPISDSMDDLLDFAFYQKEHNNSPLALDTFRQALKLYQDSEAAPYIAIEIAALLKNKGAYDEAIMVLTNGRALPGLQNNDPLTQEFITTIAYLRIVKNILLESRMGYLPFSSIPADVSQEIDDEFREWRNLA